MSEKSYVTIEQHVCAVCGQPYDTGAILLDKKLRPRFDRNTVTGTGFCPEHQKVPDDGFVILIEIDPTKSEIASGGQRCDPSKAYRTGNLVYLKREAADRIFNTPVKTTAFVDAEVIAKLQSMQKELVPKKQRKTKKGK